MTVYVDDIAHRRRDHRSYHLVADTPAELLAMACTIGVGRHRRHRDHYDIGPAARSRAIDAGAYPVCYRLLARMVHSRRTGGRLLTPEEAAATRKGEPPQ